MFIVASIEFLIVKQLEVKAKMNLHGYGIISGIVSYKDEEKLMNLMHSEKIEQISYKLDENKQEIVFSGYIESINIHKDGELIETTIVFIGATKKLDVIKKTKAFQDMSTSYKHLIKLVNMQYDNISIIFNENVERQIEDLFVQYNETDWEFLKRIASNFNTGLFPDILTTKIAYYFGVPKLKNSIKRNITGCGIECQLSEYRERKESGLIDLTEEDCRVYRIITHDKIQLGEQIVFRGMSLWVRSFCASWDRGELIYTGELVPRKGLVCTKKYNEKIIGASLDAYVDKTFADKVQVKISCDVESVHKKPKCFLYSTVFSTADGTGWYCMPEINDRVRLYFPDEKEGNGYVISSVHEDVKQENQYQKDSRTNPDNKSISTKYGKQIELTPTKISISNNKGMQIVIDDNEGIQILCDKDITIESKENINVVSMMESLSMVASEAIEFIQGNSKIILKDDVIVEGARLKLQ